MDKYNINLEQYNKIIMLADIHLGVRASSEEWQMNISDYFYKWFIPFLNKNKDRAVLFVLGDVFDNRKAINIAVNNLAIDIFEDLCKILPVYIISGNHDLYKRTHESQTSLRSLWNIEGINIIKNPSVIEFKGKENIKNILALPYLGNNEEGSYLLEYKDFDYAFMHTELTTLKMDNGQVICKGANPKNFNGKIYSGHIHTRQQKGNAVYVGSPYQLRRSDIGNDKGVYILDLIEGKHKFHKNTYSPKFQKIMIDDLMSLSEEDKGKILDNNYNDILIPEEYIKSKKYKVHEIYDLSNKFNSKRFEIIPLKNQDSYTITDSSTLYTEINLSDMVNNNIDYLENISDERKAYLKELSNNYFKAAENELENNE